MQITSIIIDRVERKSLKAVVSITINDCLIIDQIKIFTVKDDLQIGLPNKRSDDGDFSNFIEIINPHFYKLFERKILADYYCTPYGLKKQFSFPPSINTMRHLSISAVNINEIVNDNLILTVDFANSLRVFNVELLSRKEGMFLRFPAHWYKKGTKVCMPTIVCPVDAEIRQMYIDTIMASSEIQNYVFKLKKGN